MVEFLNPFLWALAFSLIPIFIYIFKLTTRKVYILPTLKIIEESQKTKGISINFEFLKLLLRVLIIVLVVLIFSQPILSQGKKDKVFIILDTTYSAKNNFDKYLAYLNEYISSIPSYIWVKIVDLTGNEIVGNRDEVKDKLKFYIPKVSKMDKGIVSRFSKDLLGSKVIVLTDGQKSFLDLLDEVGIKGYELKIFPFTLPYGSVKFSLWKRFGSEIEVQYDVNVKEESVFEMFVVYQEKSKMLMSSRISDRKVGEVKVSKLGDGIAFIKGILISQNKTNEFIEPVYFFDGRVNISESKNETLESALSVIGITNDRNAGIKLVISKFVNVDNLRNSIVIPYDSDSKIIVNGENIFGTGRSGSFIRKEYKFNTFCLISASNVNVPSGVEVYEVDKKPVLIFDKVRNNIVLLGKLNYQDINLPWFLKEVFDVFFVGSKVEFVYPYEFYQDDTISYSNNVYRILLTPDEEISEIVATSQIEGESKKNIIPLLLFCIFAIVVFSERLLK